MCYGLCVLCNLFCVCLRVSWCKASVGFLCLVRFRLLCVCTMFVDIVCVFMCCVLFVVWWSVIGIRCLVFGASCGLCVV